MLIKVKTNVNSNYEINYLQYGILKKTLRKQFKNNGGKLLKMKYSEGSYYISINTSKNDYAIFLAVLEKYLTLFELRVIDKVIK